MSTEEMLSGIVSGVNLNALTLATVARVVFLCVAGMLAIKLLMKIADRALDRAKNLAPVKSYIHSVLRIFLWFLLILMVADALSIPVTSIIALLSVAGLAVSLALQNTLSNLAGGIMILVSKPFTPGDYIEADGVGGTVAECGLAYTKLNTPDSKQIYVPNSQIASAKITNYTVLGRRRIDMTFTVTSDAPTQTVKDAIREVIAGQTRVLQDPAPEIWLSDYQSSAIQYTVRLWSAAADYWSIYFAVMEGVRESFDRYGVKMTYNHLNVHVIDRT